MPTPRKRVRTKVPTKKKKTKVLKSKAKTPTVKPTGRWEYHFERARVVAGALVLVLMGLWTTNAVLAAAWVEPTQQPPGGNPPGFVWLQAEPSIPQVGGANINGLLQSLGGAVFGSGALDLGSGTGGQNVIFGSAKYSRMNAGDALVLVQTADDAGNATDRLRVTKDGDVTASGIITGSKFCVGTSCQLGVGVALQGATPGDVQTGNFNVNGKGIVGELLVSGNLVTNGCFGPVYVGVTPATNGGVGGYTGAKERCSAAISGSHLCTVEEVLRSIQCGAFTRVGTPNNARFWLSGGPPGYLEAANDCSGWTSGSEPGAENQFGRFWIYDTQTGGRGTLSSCSESYAYSCCK